RRFHDVDDAFVSPHLELFAALLINVRAAENSVPLDAGRNRDGPADAGVGALRVVDDFLRRRIERPMIIRFHPNSDPITSHQFSPLSVMHIDTASANNREGERGGTLATTTGLSRPG